MEATEDGTKSSHVADSPAKILTWWQKFHFSGRLIMCSVLFGLGFVLIGGLIFAINLDSDVKSADKDIEDGIPPKPPARYVGPVIMGIGGFIVTVGVIMCLFETQVCRKKTGDARPLISGQTDDPESRTSDKSPVPSKTRHKSHKHKSRKMAASPKKNKSRHAKTHSHDHQKDSSRSPPIAIAKSKSYLTSSEEKFLTPPNTLDENKEATSPGAESKASASIMKSFTSSGPSWSQSTEFLTPSTSFKDSSVSMENSVEIDEKQRQVNFKTADLSDKDCSNIEYMTPLTVEEDRIQKLFIRVKNEQKEIAKQDVEGKVPAMNLCSVLTDDDISFPQTSTSEIKDCKMVKDGKNMSILTEELPSALHGTPALKSEVVQNSELRTDALRQNNNLTDGNLDPSSLPVGNEVLVNFPIPVNIDGENNLTNIPTLYDDKENSEQESNKEHDDCGLKSHFNSSTKHPTQNSNKNETQVDLESSSSSAETVISRDTLIKKQRDGETEEDIIPSTVKETPINELNLTNASESPDIRSPAIYSSSNQQNVASSVQEEKETETRDQKPSTNDTIDENCQEKITENTS